MSGRNYELTLHVVPPSMNAVGGHSHWTVFRKHKKAWQRDIEMALLVAQVPRHLQRVVAVASLRFTVDRRRDEGNFRMLLEKALGDALTNGGWLPDDTPDEYEFGKVHFESESGPARTVLTLTVT